MRPFDPEAFLEVCRRVTEEERRRDGIGTLAEKTVHAVLKAYYEPIPEMREFCLSNRV